MRIFYCLVFCAAFSAKALFASDSAQFTILETLNHDSSYFTQGLELSGDVMFESSGLYGQSRVRKYLTGNDSALVESSLPEQYFAEGLTLLNDELFVLTWKEKTVFVYNTDDLTVKRKMNYEGEGWGLANNGTQLIMSNGSDTITFRDPSTFEIENEIRVSSQQHSVQRINELEYAKGYIWANIWFSSLIIKINPITGNLAGVYDLADLVIEHASDDGRQVLNGIAYDVREDAFWVTGKLWPKRYLMKFR